MHTQTNAHIRRDRHAQRHTPHIHKPHTSKPFVYLMFLYKLKIVIKKLNTQFSKI